MAPYSLRDYLSPRGVSRAEEIKILKSLTKNNLRGFDGGASYAQGTSSAHKKSSSEIMEETLASPTLTTSLSGIHSTPTSQALLGESLGKAAPDSKPPPTPMLNLYSPSLLPAQKTVRFPLKQLSSTLPKSEVSETGRPSHTPTQKENRFSLKGLGSSFPQSVVAGTGLQAAAIASQAETSAVSPIPDSPTLVEPLPVPLPSMPSPLSFTPAPPAPAASAATSSQAGALAVTPIPESPTLAGPLPAPSLTPSASPPTPAATPPFPGPSLTPSASPSSSTQTDTDASGSGRRTSSSTTQTDRDSAEVLEAGARSTASGSSMSSSSAETGARSTASESNRKSSFTQTDSDSEGSEGSDSDSEDSDSGSEGFASAKDIGRILDAHCSRRIVLDTNSKVCIERMLSKARELRQSRAGWITAPSLYFKNLNRPNRKLCDYDVCELEAFRHQRVFKVVQDEEGQETLYVEELADCSDVAKANLQDYSCSVWFLPEITKYLWTKVTRISKRSLLTALRPLGGNFGFYVPIVTSALNAFAGVPMPLLKGLAALLPRFELNSCKDGEYTIDGVAVFIPSAVLSTVYVTLIVLLMKGFSLFLVAMTSALGSLGDFASGLSNTEAMQSALGGGLGNVLNATTNASLGNVLNATTNASLGNVLNATTNESLGNMWSAATSAAASLVLGSLGKAVDKIPNVSSLAETQRIILQTTVVGYRNVTKYVGELLDNITNGTNIITDASEAPGNRTSAHPDSTGTASASNVTNYTGAVRSFVSNVTQASLDVAQVVVEHVLPLVVPQEFEGYVDAAQQRSLIPLLDWYRHSAVNSWAEIRRTVQDKVESLEMWGPLLIKKMKALKEAVTGKGEDVKEKALKEAVTGKGEDVKKKIDEESSMSGVITWLSSLWTEGNKMVRSYLDENFNSSKQNQRTEVLSAFTATLMTDFVFRIFTTCHEFVICALAKKTLRAYRGYKLSRLSE